jgi:uncharacterized protein YbaP (TraB family)
MKNIITLFTLLVTTLCSFAQVKKQANSLLYKIEGNGLKTPSYIFGTIHLICPDKYVFGPECKAALAKSKQVCMEIDMDAPDIQSQSMQIMMLPDGKKMKSFFSEEDYKKLTAYFDEKYKMDIDAFSIMKPFVLISLMTMKNYTCENPIGYETKIIDLCKTPKKEIIGLETLEEQIGIFDRMPDTTISHMIMDYVNKPEEQQKQTEEMTDVYLKKDIEKMSAMFQDEPSMKANIDELLINRNKKWIASIEKFSKLKSTFYAVGAGHLGGNEGVLQLLKNKGYKVTAVLK